MTTVSKSLIAIALATALSACNQPATDTATEQAPQAQTDQANTDAQNTTHNAHAHHDTTKPMAAHTNEYMSSMSTMHDAMMTAATKANPDVAFVDGMIPHHQGAIEMAKIQLKYGKDATMRKLAQDIIDAQQTEIEFMQNWLTTATDKDTTNADSEHAKAYLADMSMHDAMMAGVHHDDADIAFAQGMIPHHQGAIEMAKIQLKYGQDDQIRNLAQGIIDAQDPEIVLMKEWLANKGIVSK